MKCAKEETSIERTNGKITEITIYAEQRNRPYSFTLDEIYTINDSVYIVPAFPCVVNLSTDEKESHT